LSENCSALRVHPSSSFPSVFFLAPAKDAPYLRFAAASSPSPLRNKVMLRVSFFFFFFPFRVRKRTSDQTIADFFSEAERPWVRLPCGTTFTDFLLSLNPLLFILRVCWRDLRALVDSPEIRWNSVSSPPRLPHVHLLNSRSDFPFSSEKK